MLKRQQAESIKNVTVEDPFWTPLQNLVMDVVIPYQKAILEDAVPGAEKSHAIENFRIAAGESRGEFYGMVFQDSDVAKWLEAAAYSLVLRPDAELERQADELIALIGRAQQPDGYLDTYFIVKEPEHKWQNLEECHELYCAGHMIEAGVAYYEATGKTALLDIVRKNADLICARFGKGEGQVRGVPGHQEIELALLRLYDADGGVVWVGGKDCLRDYEDGLLELMTAERFVNVFGESALKEADWRFSRDLFTWA